MENVQRLFATECDISVVIDKKTNREGLILHVTADEKNYQVCFVGEHSIDAVDFAVKLLSHRLSPTDDPESVNRTLDEVVKRLSSK